MNITILVVITSYLGYYLGLRYMGLVMIEYESWIVFIYLILGTFISSSGACILNQYFEVELYIFLLLYALLLQSVQPN